MAAEDGLTTCRATPTPGARLPRGGPRHAADCPSRSGQIMTRRRHVWRMGGFRSHTCRRIARAATCQPNLGQRTIRRAPILARAGWTLTSQSSWRAIYAAHRTSASSQMMPRESLDRLDAALRLGREEPWYDAGNGPVGLAHVSLIVLQRAFSKRERAEKPILFAIHAKRNHTSSYHV